MKEIEHKENKILINLSNHTFADWNPVQRKESEKYGRIIEIPFPRVDPAASEEEIVRLANETVEKCLIVGKNNELTVHVMGEMTLTYSIVRMLKEKGIKCIASTSERKALTENGLRLSEFSFVRFREYV